MANKKIEEIEGIGPAFGEKLRGAGINDTDTLLEKGCTKAGRKEIAEGCDIPEKKVLGWVNMADLFRISGVGPEYAELLECSGVDTVKELAQRKPENLQAKMADVNAAKKLVRQIPSVDQVKDWVAQAGKLPRMISH